MKKNKKIPFIVLGVLAFLAVLALLAGLYASNLVQKRISRALPTEASYKKIDVDLWQKHIVVTDFEYEEGKKRIFSSRIVLDGIDYWEYIINDRIEIGDLVLEEPEIRMQDRDKKEPLVPPQAFKKKIFIEKFRATSGTFRLLGSEVAKNAVFVHFPELQLSEVSIDSSTLKEKIPFNYTSYEFFADSIRLNMNPEHFIAAAEMKLKDKEVMVKDFRIIPYFTKTEFDRTVGYEKDRISLKVDSITMNNFDFAFKHDILHLRAPFMKIVNGNLQIYRNRLLPDTIFVKPLYSQVLRNAPVKMAVDEIEVTDTKIVYEEKLREGRPAAKVGFYDINGKIKNLTNMRLDRQDFPTTKVDVNANFLHVAPLVVNWSFDINDLEDRFLISGNFGSVPATALNDYLKPAMNVEAEGALNSVAFTFSGGEETAVGDVRVAYDQFKIQLLEEDGSGVRKFLSSIANLFVDNDGLSEEDVAKDVEFTRDPTKSFWNYIWSGLQKGLKESLSQL